ncbi:DNA topoisomerase III [Giardia duodenalis]|uniref:DNA topoisomerase III n=1 Tax=Giardia intestinalis TaxID=5741 RepID=V6TU70_GIAIN|nr:DNA topoisomerase III [Giardia intestinalis]
MFLTLVTNSALVAQRDGSLLIALDLSYTWENGWDSSRKNATFTLHNAKIVYYSVSNFFLKDDKVQEGNQWQKDKRICSVYR